MLSEEFLVGNKERDENATFQREITRNTRGCLFDFSARIILPESNEQIEIGLFVGIASGPRAKEGDP